MKILDSSRYALSSCVAAALLAGCGGSQPPIGAQLLQRRHRFVALPTGGSPVRTVKGIGGEVYAAAVSVAPH